ncbi:MAG: hypothetical protein IPG71_03875 [bacterium]|nr:hypothetical protein [bacterium]
MTDTRTVHTVGPSGAFASLSAAITAASPGDVIQVQPGLYRESLVIDKDLEITGSGRTRTSS